MFLCHNLTGGGAERVCAALAEGLSRMGHDVSIFTNLRQPTTYYLGGNVKLLHNNFSGSNFISRRISAFKCMRKTILEEKPNVIISIQPYFTDIARLITWFSYKCPIIMTEHDALEFPEDAPMSANQKFNKFILNHLYDYITVLTEADYALVKNKFRNVCVMYNPLFLEPICKPSLKEKIILAVGRIDSWHYKGFDILIKAWNRISNLYPEWKLCIVGKGTDANIEFLNGLAMDNSSLQIKPYTENIALEYQKSEIFVLSSRYEAFGLVLIEAMSQGCACIACDYKGRQAGIIDDGNTGLLCDVENEKMLADKIQSLIINVAFRKKLQDNAPKAVSKYSIENVAERWNSFLHKIISE